MSNTANYGSALVMSRCHNSSIKHNIFSNNYAKTSGAVYWIKSSGMVEPVGIRKQNKYINNQAKYFGKDYSTEIVELITVDSNVLRIDTYKSDDYPIQTKVALRNYYNDIDYSDSNSLVEARLEIPHCDFMVNYAELKGSVITQMVSGFASFDKMAANCIPGKLSISIMLILYIN